VWETNDRTSLGYRLYAWKNYSPILITFTEGGTISCSTTCLRSLSTAHNSKLSIIESNKQTTNKKSKLKQHEALYHRLGYGRDE